VESSLIEVNERMKSAQPVDDDASSKTNKGQHFDRPLNSSWHDSVVQGINFLQLGWHAEAYSRYVGMSAREMMRSAGLNRKIPRAMMPEMAPTFLSVSSTNRRSRVSVEPNELDWRKKDGKNFLDPIITQGDCGSCYGISTVRMLSARNRVRSGNPQEPAFSINFPLYCAEYNQACDGGYGFLHTKWSEDVGLIPEQCSPFSQGGGGCKSSMAKCDMGAKRYRALNHHYVGGYYGGSDADLIRTELMSNGPLVMSFEPKEDFMYYKNGIYKSGADKIHQEWQQVDHAVLLVGLGEENGQRYWTMQNSWGKDWGEDGFFRMDRGNDESGCESIVVAAEVVEETSNAVLDGLLSSMGH